MDALRREHILVRCAQWARDPSFRAAIQQMLHVAAAPLAGRPTKRRRLLLQEADAAVTASRSDWSSLPPEMRAQVLDHLQALAQRDPAAQEAMARLAQASWQDFQDVDARRRALALRQSPPGIQRLVNVVADNRWEVFLFTLQQWKQRADNLSLDELGRVGYAIGRANAAALWLPLSASLCSTAQHEALLMGTMIGLLMRTAWYHGQWGETEELRGHMGVLDADVFEDVARQVQVTARWRVYYEDGLFLLRSNDAAPTHGMEEWTASEFASNEDALMNSAAVLELFTWLVEHGFRLPQDTLTTLDVDTPALADLLLDHVPGVLEDVPRMRDFFYIVIGPDNPETYMHVVERERENRDAMVVALGTAVLELELVFWTPAFIAAFQHTLRKLFGTFLLTRRVYREWGLAYLAYGSHDKGVRSLVLDTLLTEELRRVGDDDAEMGNVIYEFIGDRIAQTEEQDQELADWLLASGPQMIWQPLGVRVRHLSGHAHHIQAAIEAREAANPSTADTTYWPRRRT